MNKLGKIALGITIPFALVTGAAFDYHFEQKQKSEKAAQKGEGLKQQYDSKMVPALLQVALDRCGDRDANIHGLLAAKFIFDSNANDDVRKLLKEKKVDPHHYGSYETPGGDGYMSAENALKLAKFLIDNNIAATAEPDRYKGQKQAEYLNNGTGGGRLVFYYQPAPSDYDGKNKPWIPEQYKQIPADGIYVPMSEALGTFLNELMNGKYNYTSHHQVSKVPGTDNQWEIKSRKLVMDGPAAPVAVQKPAPTN